MRQHLDVTIETNHDVCRLQIAMDNTRAMRCAKRIENLPRDFPASVQGRCALEPIAQCLAFHQFGHKVVWADVMERADIWMVQRRDRSRLALEASAELARLGRKTPVPLKWPALPTADYSWGNALP